MSPRALRTLSSSTCALATLVGWATLSLVVPAAGCGEDVTTPSGLSGPDDPSAPDTGDPDGAALAAEATWSVYLRTEVTGQYLSARNAGGSTVTAAGAAPREWERFQLVDANGGKLVDGDRVFLRAHNGTSFLQAVNGGGGEVNAAATSMTEAAAFDLVRVAGPGDVALGDTIGLRTRTRQFVTAQNGGGGAVRATAPVNDAWEHFVISGTNGDPPPPPPTNQRVVGYLPNWYGSYADWATKIDFSKLTHVNLAFVLADDGGNPQLASDSQIAAFVNAAHARGVKVFPSLCGGGGDNRIAPHYQPGRVDAFVDKIIAFTLRHRFDGIDVDVEAPQRMGAAYDTFIAKLKAKAAPHGLPVTAAVAPWMQSGMSNETLRSFDFITVMSYDNAGTWTGPGAHSSYQQAVDALAFYTARGVARDKIVLGVPFYGYCWGNCGGGRTSVYLLYKDILDRFPDAWNTDWIDRDGARVSFNGQATMRAKTQLARGYGGIMIWELAGDKPTSHARSLLSTIWSSR